MSRKCVQLLSGGPDVDTSDAGIVGLWIESQLLYPLASTPVDAEADVCTMSCLLLQTTSTPGAAAQRALLAASMQGVRTRAERFGGSDPAVALAASMASRRDDFGSAVVVLGPRASAQRDVQPLLDGLRSRDRDTTGPILAVASEPSAWAHLQGIDGFVAAPAGDEVAVSSRLALVLSSLMAPDVRSCMDAEDMMLAVGGPHRPSELVEALWVAPSESLMFASEAEEALFRRSPAFAATVYAHGGTLGNPIARTLGALAVDKRSMAYHMPVDFLADASAADAWVRLHLLCARPGD